MPTTPPNPTSRQPPRTTAENVAITVAQIHPRPQRATAGSPLMLSASTHARSAITAQESIVHRSLSDPTMGPRSSIQPMARAARPGPVSTGDAWLDRNLPHLQRGFGPIVTVPAVYPSSLYDHHSYEHREIQSSCTTTAQSDGPIQSITPTAIASPSVSSHGPSQPIARPSVSFFGPIQPIARPSASSLGPQPIARPSASSLGLMEPIARQSESSLGIIEPVARQSESSLGIIEPIARQSESSLGLMEPIARLSALSLGPTRPIYRPSVSSPGSIPELRPLISAFGDMQLSYGPSVSSLGLSQPSPLVSPYGRVQSSYHPQASSYGQRQQCCDAYGPQYPETNNKYSMATSHHQRRSPYSSQVPYQQEQRSMYMANEDRGLNFRHSYAEWQLLNRTTLPPSHSTSTHNQPPQFLYNSYHQTPASVYGPISMPSMSSNQQRETTSASQWMSGAAPGGSGHFGGPSTAMSTTALPVPGGDQATTSSRDQPSTSVLNHQSQPTTKRPIWLARPREVRRRPKVRRAPRFCTTAGNEQLPSVHRHTARPTAQPSALGDTPTQMGNDQPSVTNTRDRPLSTYPENEMNREVPTNSVSAWLEENQSSGNSGIAYKPENQSSNIAVKGSPHTPLLKEDDAKSDVSFKYSVDLERMVARLCDSSNSSCSSEDVNMIEASSADVAAAVDDLGTCISSVRGRIAFAGEDTLAAFERFQTAYEDLREAVGQPRRMEVANRFNQEPVHNLPAPPRPELHHGYNIVDDHDPYVQFADELQYGNAATHNAEKCSCAETASSSHDFIGVVQSIPTPRRRIIHVQRFLSDDEDSVGETVRPSDYLMPGNYPVPSISLPMFSNSNEVLDPQLTVSASPPWSPRALSSESYISQLPVGSADTTRSVWTTPCNSDPLNQPSTSCSNEPSTISTPQDSLTQKNSHKRNLNNLMDERASRRRMRGSPTDEESRASHRRCRRSSNEREDRRSRRLYNEEDRQRNGRPRGSLKEEIDRQVYRRSGPRRKARRRR